MGHYLFSYMSYSRIGNTYQDYNIISFDSNIINWYISMGDTRALGQFNYTMNYYYIAFGN